MPADEDYVRRHSILQISAASPASAASGDRFQTTSPANRFSQERLAAPNDKGAGQLVERLEPPERFQSNSERFVSERSNSDRLPSGERYQGVSERYPLGDRLQTAVSSERLVQPTTHCQGNNGERQTFQPERYMYTDRNQKYPDRFTPIQNIGSLDRYHNHATLDRCSRTSTPTDRYNTIYTDKERCSSSNDRYTPIEKYSTNESFNSNDRHSAQNVNTLGRHTPTERPRRSHNEREQYFASQNAPTSDMYKRRDRSRSSERKSIDNTFQQHTENYRYEMPERFPSDRFPPIPCPERFATQERNERPEKISFTQVPYMAPPSPAPTSDRFIPPPPLSPTNTPSPDCYASNTFPSPTNSVPPERFVPPPPLSPSPTETFSPKKQREMYSERYATSPNPNDRYVSYQQERIKDRNQYYTSNERYPAPHQTQTSYNTLPERYINVQERFANGDRTTVPPNPHTPVERYTPQQQEPYYQYERYPKYNPPSANNGDPYMRRDLSYNQFRVTVPFQQNPYQRIRYMGTPSRTKCCQYQECYQLCKSSPCSSSSSSVTSQGKEIQKEVASNSNVQEVQCQNISGFQQEKAIQCGNFNSKEVQCTGFQIVARIEKKDVACAGYVSPNLRTGKVQCRHGICASPSVEYVGQSGGRHVCATPPPRGSIGSADGSICSDQCCVRRSQNTLSVW